MTQEVITQEELFKRLAVLEGEKLVLSEDIKSLKAQAKYHKDDNPQGIAKEDVALIAAAAKLEAKKDFEEQQEKANAVFNKYVELTGYDD